MILTMIIKTAENPFSIYEVSGSCFGIRPPGMTGFLPTYNDSIVNTLQADSNIPELASGCTGSEQCLKWTLQRLLECREQHKKCAERQTVVQSSHRSFQHAFFTLQMLEDGLVTLIDGANLSSRVVYSTVSHRCG
jgi:hypothetical protein